MLRENVMIIDSTECFIIASQNHWKQHGNEMEVDNYTHQVHLIVGNTRKGFFKTIPHLFYLILNSEGHGRQ